jgi:hypothetical protein
MPEHHLHIVSFSIPFPANYGGVIDVFYKIKALYRLGIRIHLHCFEYENEPSPVLATLCESVNYYPRKTGFLKAMKIRPYIVASRCSDELINNLLKDNYPILFEGLHSCYWIDDSRLKNRTKIYRESNIEHQYYYQLFKAEKKLPAKCFFLAESLKLRLYQRILKNASLMLVVSQSDAIYLRRHFPKNRIVYLPSFHPNSDFRCQEGKGKFALYHGKLSVPENYRVAEFLIKKVFNDLDVPLLIAGLNAPSFLTKLSEGAKNIELVNSPSHSEMQYFIENAQVNIMITFQASGLKLKLLNALYNGRFVLANDAMTAGTSLKDLCSIANTAEEMKKSINQLFSKEFEPYMIEERRRKIEISYANTTNAEKLKELIFPA